MHEEQSDINAINAAKTLLFRYQLHAVILSDMYDV